MVNQPVDAVTKVRFDSYIWLRIQFWSWTFSIKLNVGDQAVDGDGHAGSIFKFNT